MITYETKNGGNYLKLVVDTHTHTLSSGHAYSTICENAIEGAKNGIEAIAMTDHGPAMEGATSRLHFWNLNVIPDYINGVRIIKGAEANITDHSGNLDIPEGLLGKMEFAVASFHSDIIKPGTVEENTQCLIKVLSNPYIDAIGHPGNPKYPVDIDKVVRAAAEYNKLVEINNSSFRIRKGSEVNCIEFASKCIKYNARVICGTDAHICFDIGKFEMVQKVLDRSGIPEELVLCTSLDKVEGYLKERLHRIGTKN